MEEQYGQQVTIRRNFKGAKLLLVEDNPDHVALIQTVLQACMPEVELLMAATVEEALSELSGCLRGRKELPRLILLDLYVPQREQGWTFFKRLKENGSPYRLIPVTLLSHSENLDDIQTSYDLGATSYIVKPVDYSQWLSYFESLRQYWWQTVTVPLR